MAAPPTDPGATAPHAAGFRARLSGRLGLWSLPLQAMLLVLLLAPLFAHFGLRPSPETVFAVQARSGVLEVQPTCERSLIWDLPGGRLIARQCGADDPADCGGLHEAVTATLSAGSSARIEMRADGRWGITFGVADRASCGDPAGMPVRITADYDELPPDESGYFYVAEPLLPGEPPPAFALPLAGRITIGQFVEFGGGWSDVQSPTLSGGRVFGRDVAIGTGERLTLLDEELDPGSIVDTHPRQAGAVEPGDTAAEPVATGFVLSSKDDGDRHDMLVQVSQRRSVAVIPYDGLGRRLEIPRWKVWWNSPLLQLVASIVGVLGALLGIYIASQEGQIAYRDLRQQAEQRQATPAPASGPITAGEAPPGPAGAAASQPPAGDVRPPGGKPA